MTKSEIKKIEYHFRNYEKIRREAITSTVDWATESMATDYSKVAVQTSPSNAREKRLCNIIDKSAEALRWTNVVEKVLDRYKFESKGQMIQLRYFRGYSVRKTCSSVGISVATYKRWRNEIMELTADWRQELRVFN